MGIIMGVKWDNRQAIHVNDEEEFLELRQIFRDYFAEKVGALETVNIKNWERYPYIYLKGGFHGCAKGVGYYVVEFSDLKISDRLDKTPFEIDCQNLVSLI